MPSTRDPAIAIEPMTADDWPAVRRIYTEGIATGDATLEHEAPDWRHFDRSHPPECRLVARHGRRRVVGWTALGGYSARKRLQRRRLGERLRGGRSPRPRRWPRPPRSAHRSVRGGRLLDAARRRPRRERAPASPSTNGSGSGGSASSARIGQDPAAAGGTWSCSNAGARWSADRLNVPPRPPVIVGSPRPSGSRPTGGRGGSRPRRAGPQGDREAFAVLVHQVSDALYAVAQRILRDTGLAEDALQNALVLAWRRLPHLRDPERFEAWIHRILVHACYDESQRAANGRRTSGSCPSMGRRRRTAPPPSPTATSWSGHSAGSRSTSGRSSSCTTTSGCRSWRSPRCWGSPRARPDRDCTTPRAASATP